MQSPVSPLPDRVDVVVIGAGPAGATVAALLRKYRPETEVLVLERDTFPRHRIGESLLAEVNAVLDDMGCLAEVEAAAFSRKWGVNFASGADRRRTNFDWVPNAESIAPEDARPGHYTWHVDRADYDQILIDRAAALGVQVRFGAKVLESTRRGDAVTGVKVLCDGTVQRVRADWVVDAGGQTALLTRSLGGRQNDPALTNVAVYGYLRGVKWVDGLTGSEERPRTAILTHAEGWVWVIPLRNGITSVGFVTHLETHQANRNAKPDASLEASLAERLRTLAEFDTLFANTDFIDYPGTKQRVMVVQDFSSSCQQVGGPGWALVGDAAGFIDPILSTGCFLGQSHAQYLASALADILDGRFTAEQALDAYATTLSENIAAFREIAYLFYRFSIEASAWWRTCAASLEAKGCVPISDSETAFRAFLTGFQQRMPSYEDAIASLGASFLTQVGDLLFDGALPLSGESFDRLVQQTRQALESGGRIVLDRNAVERPFLLPDVGTRRLSPVIRIEVAPHVATAADSVAYKAYVPAALGGCTALFDGTRTCAEVAELLPSALPVGERTAHLLRLAERLVCMGAATFTQARPALTGARAHTSGRDLCGIDIGRPRSVATPSTAAEISALIQAARRDGTAVVPVGIRSAYWNALQLEDATALDLRGLDTVGAVDLSGGFVWVGAGATVAAVRQKLEAQGLMLRAHPDAYGDTSIGAMVATGFSSGLGAADRTIEQLVAGLEFVDGTGTIVRSGAAAALSKDPTQPTAFERVGLPDPTALLMASGGTLGVITRVALRVSPYPWLAQLVVTPEPSQLWAGAYAVAEALRHTRIVHTLRATHTLDASSSARLDLIVMSDLSADERDARVAHAQSVITKAFGAPAEVVGVASAVSPGLPWLEPARDDVWHGMESDAFVGVDVVTDYADPRRLLGTASRLVAQAQRLKYRSLRTALYFGPTNVNLGLHWTFDGESRKSGRALHDAAVRLLAAQSVVPYRMGRGWRSAMEDRLDPGYRDLMTRLKQAMDPDGILHPGADTV